ncbi:MAG: protein kinase [Planctomycetes bacterium]|nr:protein kinase [Planctomycetota bacterium]
MTDASWSRVRELFERADQVPAGELEAWLDAQCGGDAALRARVAALLRADHDAAATTAAFDATIPVELLAEVATGTPGAALVGRTIGGFRATAVLGAGGMGVVLRAEQEQPRREIALKVLAGPLVTERTRRRFQYEGEVLGRLQHAHIAQVFATGDDRDAVSGQQLCWIAMELVPDALPIDRYAASHGLDERARLRLFLDVCDAVAHGHRQGVLHRDLKPGNVLVAGDGRVKVIDFGIARATDPDAAGQTMTGQVLGTPRYMSPEQLAGDTARVDTRTDVFALGVMLFELLTGRPPRDFDGVSFEAFARQVANASPPRPSATSATERDLDWICVRAMDPEPEGRYGSVAELAADLRRYLAGEPVSVGPPSVLYTLRRFVRRHRALVAVGAAGVLALLVGALVSTLGWIDAARSAKLAHAEADTQTAITSWLTELLQSARADKQGRDVLVRDLLDAGEGRLGELAAQPAEIEAALRNVMAQTWLSLGENDRALTILRDGAARRRDELPAAHSDRAEACYLLGLALDSKGEFDAARAELERALALRVEHGGADTVDAAHVLHALGVNDVRRGHADAADAHFAQAQLLFAQQLGDDDAKTLRVIADRVDAAHQLEHYDAVRAELRSARDRALRALGGAHPVTLGLVLSAANDDRHQGDFAAAESGYEQALQLTQEVYGEHSSKARQILGNLAVLRQDRGDLPGAVAAFEQLVAAHETAGDDVLQEIIARNNLASLLLRSGDAARSLAAYEALLAKAAGKIPTDHWLHATFLRGRGAALTALARYEEAQTDLLRSVEVFAKALGDDNARTQTALQSVVDLYAAWQKPDLAEPFRQRLQKR